MQVLLWSQGGFQILKVEANGPLPPEQERKTHLGNVAIILTEDFGQQPRMGIGGRERERALGNVEGRKQNSGRSLCSFQPSCRRGPRKGLAKSANHTFAEWESTEFGSTGQDCTNSARA